MALERVRGFSRFCMGTNRAVISRRRVNAFRATVYGHFEAHGRSFPWRDTRDPYEILVSEVMLQQTQTSRVLPKYREFLTQFPDFDHLARSPLKAVLTTWQGLGYNRRARALKECAERVMSEHRGRLPETSAELMALPGIGPYTAGALMAFAHGVPSVIIETNIRTVFLHEFFSESPSLVHDREIRPLIELTLDTAQPRTWYYALMDYGSHLKSCGRGLNQKSAAYRRQTPFRGSRREIRGRIIALLTCSPLDLATLRDALKGEAVDGVIDELIRERLLDRRGDEIAIRS
jgi:A/G-specific adenine glycosylase